VVVKIMFLDLLTKLEDLSLDGDAGLSRHGIGLKGNHGILKKN
jgi:hypothetical protein